MPASLLIAGIPTPIFVGALVILAIVLVFAILKRLFKLALIAGAVAAGLWLGLRLVG